MKTEIVSNRVISEILKTKSAISQSIPLSPMTLLYMGFRNEGEQETPEQIAEREANEQKDIDALIAANPNLASYFEKQRTEAVTAATAKVKTDTLAEVEVNNKKEKARLAREAARASGDKDAETAAIKQEAEDLKTEAQKMKDDAAAEKLEALKISVATKFKLPDSIAKRLMGTTREELEADAADLRKTFPVTKTTELEGGNKDVIATSEKQLATASKVVKNIVRF